MADISNYEKSIREQKRGEVVRDAIANAIKAINSLVENTKKLGGLGSDQYAKFSDLIVMTRDKKPTKDSKNLVESQGLYEVFGGEKDPAKASSDTLPGKVQTLYNDVKSVAEAINSKDVKWAIGNPITGYGNAIRQIYKYKMENKTITKNGTYDAPKKTLWRKLTVRVGKTDVIPITITENGVYEAPDGFSYSPVTVDVPNNFVCEYNKDTKIFKCSVLFKAIDLNPYETELDIETLLNESMSSSDIFDLMTKKGSSMSDIVSSLLKNGKSGNQIANVLSNNGISMNQITTFLKNNNLDGVSIVNSLTGGALKNNNYDDVIGGLDSAGFSVDDIASSLKGSNTDVNTFIKAIEETTDTYTFDKFELIQKLRGE